MITIDALFSKARLHISSCIVAYGAMAVNALTKTVPQLISLYSWKAFIMWSDWLECTEFLWPDLCIMRSGDDLPNSWMRWTTYKAMGLLGLGFEISRRFMIEGVMSSW